MLSESEIDALSLQLIKKLKKIALKHNRSKI